MATTAHKPKMTAIRAHKCYDPPRPHTTRDCITALPSELLHMIFDWMLLHHEADKALALHASVHRSSSLQKDPPGCWHPLDYLSATCSTIRREINSWAVSVLTQYSSLTGKSLQNLKEKRARKQSAKKRSDESQLFNALRGRQGLLTWIQKHCIFCGKKTQRRAIFLNGLACCDPCDRQEWPDKITKTAAMKEYNLEYHQLHPRWSKTTGLPKIHYGTYVTMGSVAQMFMRPEVKMVAQLVHGDLDSHLAQRRDKQEKRKLKRAENERRKRQQMQQAIRRRYDSDDDSDDPQAHLYEARAVPQTGIGLSLSHANASGSGSAKDPLVLGDSDDAESSSEKGSSPDHISVYCDDEDELEEASDTSITVEDG